MSQTPDLPEQTPVPDTPTDLVPTRVLWFSFGTAAGLAVTVASVAIVWGAGGTTSLITSLVSSFTSIGLLATAIWAAAIGARTMKASQESSRATQRASAAAEEANRQAALDSHRAHRPYVGVEVVPGLASADVFDLRITNYGRSAARDLTIEYVPETNRTDVVTKSVVEMFTTPRTLLPGASLRIIWHIRHDPDSDKTFVDSDGDEVTGPLGMPVDATLTLEYTSDNKAEKFTDTFEVMCLRSGLWPIPASGSTPQNGPIKLRHLHSLGEAIARHLGEANR